MLLSKAQELVGRSAEFVGQEMVESDSHCGGVVGRLRIDAVILRDDWFCFVLEGHECGGRIDTLHWDEQDARLSSRFGTSWYLVR